MILFIMMRGTFFHPIKIEIFLLFKIKYLRAKILMHQYILTHNFVINNIISVYIIILFFAVPIVIVVSDISLFIITLIGIVWLVLISYLKNTDEVFQTNHIITTGVPIAKVIWTQPWECESKRFVSRYSMRYSEEYYNTLLNIQMRFFANIWDELHVKYLNNSFDVLHNYNTIKPVRGTLLHYTNLP